MTRSTPNPYGAFQPYAHPIQYVGASPDFVKIDGLRQAANTSDGLATDGANYAIAYSTQYVAALKLIKAALDAWEALRVETANDLGFANLPADSKAALGTYHQNAVDGLAYQTGLKEKVTADWIKHIQFFPKAPPPVFILPPGSFLPAGSGGATPAPTGPGALPTPSDGGAAPSDGGAIPTGPIGPVEPTAPSPFGALLLAGAAAAAIFLLVPRLGALVTKKVRP